MKLIPISDIIQTDRARQDLGEIGALAESIRQHGLLQPIVVDKNMILRCGGRRLAAVKLLCWKEVPAVILEYLSPTEQLEVELEENARRKDLTWQETLDLRINIIKQYQALDKPPTNEYIASRLGIEKEWLSNCLLLARWLERNPELRKLDTIATALTQATRLQQNQLRALSIQANGPINLMPGQTNESVVVNSPPPEGSTIPSSITLYLGDSREILKQIPDESIDLILTDPPFGVDYDYWEAGFDDSKNAILDDLLPPIFTECYRVLKPGAHFYMLYPIIHHNRITQLINDSGFRLHYVPLIWDKQLGPANQRYYGMDYEPILLAYKAPTMRPLQEPARCTFRYQTVTGERTHPTERPVELLQRIINLATIPGETVLDPFAGSGSTAIAAIHSGRSCITIEQDPNFYNSAAIRLRNEGGDNVKTN